jgi:hypothetical protein
MVSGRNDYVGDDPQMQQGGVQLVPPVVNFALSRENLFGDLFNFTHAVVTVH